MTTLEIIQLGVITAAIVAIVIYIIIMGIKNKWIQKLTKTIELSIAEAEIKFNSGEGDKKKQYVIDAVKLKCKELEIPYDLLYKLINKLIDTIVAHYNVIEKHDSEK